MKFKNIVLLGTAIALYQCKTDSGEAFYPNESVVVDNAQAALYFHTVFREAENVWGFIDSVEYVPGTYHDPGNNTTRYKNITYNGNTATIEYNAWKVANHSLIGTIVVTFVKNAYRIVESSIASVKLANFSINGQTVTGESQMVSKNKNSQYTFTLFDGSAIHEQGSNKPVIISGSISSGQYERTKGDATYTQADDEWAYSGTMTGLLHENPNLKYTNTVQTGAVTVNGVKYEATPVIFTSGCKTAKHGASKIVINGRPDILYVYKKCDEYEFESVTKVN